MGTAPVRDFDVAVLGSSGFTGCRVLGELVTQIRSCPKHPALTYPLKIAAAGRNKERVREFMARVGVQEGPDPSSGGGPSACGTADVTTVEADVLDPDSIAAFCRSTRLVLDCVGPYRFYGRPVVAACVAAGTDYLDISGEPEFMERTLQEFGEAAAASGSLVVSACGFDSVPADLGMQASLRALSARHPPPDSSASVSSYLTVHAPLGAKGHYGTWESLVFGLASVGELRNMRKSTTGRSRGGVPDGPKVSSRRRKSSLGFLPKWVPEVKAWVLPFPGSDSAVVRRSLAHAAQQRAASATPTAGSAASGGESDVKQPLLSGVAAERVAAPNTGGPRGDLPAAAFQSVRYAAYFTIKAAWQAYLFLAWGAAVFLMAQLEFTRSLLLKHPELFSFGGFSRQGPSPEQMEATSFEMRFDARVAHEGVQGSEESRHTGVTLVVHGPELGYVVTPWIIVQAGLTLLSSRSAMPSGVLTPAVAFAATDLQQRLETRGMRFEVLPGVK